MSAAGIIACCIGGTNIGIPCDCPPGSPFPGGMRIGEWEIAFSGVTLPSTIAGPDYREKFVSGGGVLDGLGNPDYDNLVWMAATRTGYAAQGAVPAKFNTACLYDRGLGNVTAEELPDVDCTRLMPIRFTYKANYRPEGQDNVPSDLLAYTLPAFPTNFYFPGCTPLAGGFGDLASLCRRFIVRGDWTPFSTGAPWPFVLPVSGSVTPSHYTVLHTSAITSHVVDDQPTLILRCSATIITKYPHVRVWPALPVGDQPTANDSDVCAIRTSVVWFHGVIERGVDVTNEEFDAFPCSRSTWTFRNILTPGVVTRSDGTTDGASYDSSPFAITSGGTATLRARSCRYWLGDAPAQYRLQMKVGQPDAATDSLLTEDNETIEDVDIVLDRYLVADREYDAEGAPVGIWYGEDAKYRARIDTRKHRDVGTWLTIERKENWPNGFPPWQMKFKAQFVEDEWSPPESSPTRPRYWLDRAHPSYKGCRTAAGFIPFELENLDFDVNFAYGPIILTKQGGLLPVPASPCPTAADDCPTTYKVAWKTDGTSIKLLAAGDATPSGHEAVIVTYDAALAVWCVWSNAYTADADKVVLRLTNARDGFYAGDVYYVSPPRWEITIQQALPIATITASVPVNNASQCPVTGDYTDRVCITVGDLCETPAGSPCKIKYVVQIIGATGSPDIAPLIIGQPYDLYWDPLAFKWIIAVGDSTAGDATITIDTVPTITIDTGDHVWTWTDATPANGTHTLTASGTDATLIVSVTCVVVDESTDPCGGEVEFEAADTGQYAVGPGGDDELINYDERWTVETENGSGTFGAVYVYSSSPADHIDARPPARWIGIHVPGEEGTVGGGWDGVRIFRTTVNVSGDEEGLPYVSLAGRIGVNNQVLSISVNGTPVLSSVATDYEEKTLFSLPGSAFVIGANTVDFEVFDSAEDSPVGALLVEWFINDPI